MMGEFSARKIRKNKQRLKWKDIKYRARMLRFWKKDPLEGSPQARGIVLEKRVVEQKQPSSGLIKCVRVQIVKNGVGVTAWVPGTGAIDKVNEHDEVVIEGVGGSQGGPIGKQWGIKFTVVKVNGVALKELVSGKKQKPTR
ncbi:MAG: 30S ribosomal protein S12 [Candidatus Aenigmatarchaeota archaeon]